jgi:hypothetical protein
MAFLAILSMVQLVDCWGGTFVGLSG